MIRITLILVSFLVVQKYLDLPQSLEERERRGKSGFAENRGFDYLHY